MKSIIYMLLLVTLMGCQYKGGKSQEKATGNNIMDTATIELTIDPGKIPSVPFDSLMDDVKFVRLQTDDRCLIGAVSQFICTDHYIFVMDREVSRAVFCFDMQGRFIRKIGAEGQGPAEYVRLCNITLSADKKHLIIVDWAAKLLYYDFNGNLKKTVRMGPETNSFDAVEEISEQFIVGFVSSGYAEEETLPMLFVTDSDMQEIEYRALPTYQTELFHMNDGMFPLRKYGDNIYLNRPWSESFYRVGANSCTEMYHLNIVGGGFPEITEDINGDTYLELSNRTAHIDDYVFLKDASLFFFFVPKAGWNPFVVYYHKTGSMLRCSGNYINPLFEFYSAINTPLVRLGDNVYVVQHAAGEVLHKKKKIYNNPLILEEALEKLYDGLTEDDNPVLFFYRLKV